MRYYKVLCLWVLLLIPASSALSFYVQEDDISVAVNKDGSLDISYDLAILTTSGTQNGMFFNIPTDDTEVLSIEDESGRLGHYNVEPDVLRIFFLEQKSKGKTSDIRIRLRSPAMVFERDGRAAVHFVPSWFDQAIKRMDVEFVLPDITEFEAEPQPSSTGEKGGKTAIHWQISDIAADENAVFLVTFPKGLVDQVHPERELRERFSVKQEDYWLVWQIVFVVGIIMFVLYELQKKKGNGFRRRNHHLRGRTT